MRHESPRHVRLFRGSSRTLRNRSSQVRLVPRQGISYCGGISPLSLRQAELVVEQGTRSFCTRLP